MPSFRVLVVLLAAALSIVLVFVVESWLRPDAVGKTRAMGDVHTALFDELAARSEIPPAPLDATGLRREVIPEDVARRIMHRLSYAELVYDELAYWRWRPNVEVTFHQAEARGGHWTITTNSLGIRGGDREPAAARPDLRVLVVGDSQSEGYCRDNETYSARVEAALRAAHPDKAIEVLNASCGGYSFYHHLGALERFLDLEPDLFIHAVYGGNDFAEVLGLHHYFERIPPPSDARTTLDIEEKQGEAIPGRFRAAGITQAHLFQRMPAALELARDASQRVTRAIRRRCEEAGIAYLCLYIPSVDEVQPERYPESHGAALMALGLTAEGMQATPRAASALLRTITQDGGAVLDLTDALAAANEDLYWHQDHHLNPAGHRWIAEALTPVIGEHLALRR